MSAANHGLRFILEMLALVAIGYWGWRTGDSLPLKLILSVGAVLLFAVVWAVFRADKGAIVEVATGVRIGIEVAAFAAATAAMFAIGQAGAAVAFAVVATINEILDYTV